MDPLLPHDPPAVSRYRLLGRLGSGGMGVVYLGQSPGGRLVAVKCVHRELAGDAEFRRRFARESAAAKSVGGFHTAPVVDADPHGDPPWLVTAFIPGLTLAEAIVAAGGALPDATVRALGAGLTEALAAIHAAGLVHRDLKPSNVLVTDDGPRVIDFGIARALDDTALTRSHMSIGTPGFSSPEQLTGAQVGPASDVFSLGLVLCHAGGLPPFGKGNAEAMLYRIVHQEPDVNGVPADMRDVVAGCLAKNPADRPAPADLLTLWSAATTSGAGWLPVEVNTRIAAVVAGTPATVASGIGQAPPPDPAARTYGTPAPAPAPAPDPSGVSGTTGAPYPAGAFSATATSPTPPFAPDAVAQVAGKGPSDRTKALLAVAATLGLAAAGTGIYFGLHGSGGSPSASGNKTPTSAPAAAVHTLSSTPQSATPAGTIPAGPLSSDHGLVIECATGTINGSGSATQEAAIDKLIAAYEAACPGATIGYKATGFGLNDFSGGHVDFTAQDVPMTADQRSVAGRRCGTGGSAASVVVSAQPDVIVYKIPGVAPTALNLSATTLAKIFNGLATSWNDPAIVHDNPGLTLPKIPIRQFHWGQAAGISYALSDYLHASDQSDFSQPPDVNWPGGGGMTLGGSDSMVQSISSTDGSIGYLDAATATAHNLGIASLDGVRMTIQNATFHLDSSAGDFTGGNVILRPDFRTRIKDRYPFVSFAYEITCVTGNDPASLPLLKSFLGYVASPPGQSMLRDAGYTNLPDTAQAQTKLTFHRLQ